MKKIIFFIFLIHNFIWSNDCKLKIEELQKELEYAKKYNNNYKINDLSSAINELSLKCKNDTLYYTKLLEDKMKKENELKELEKELDILEDNEKKMNKAEYKNKKTELKNKREKLKQELKNLKLY